MSHIDRDDFLEKKQMELDNDLIGHLVLDNRAMSDFICWMDEKDSKVIDKLIVIDKLLDEWLKTKDGQAWYNKTLDYLTDAPERPDEDYDR